MEGRITVATDGRDGAVGALHVALALSRRGSGPVLVVAVQEPMTEIGLVSPEEMRSLRLLEQASSARLQQIVETQLHELGPETAAWELRVQVGAPPASIADAARDHGASLLLLGIGRHTPANRWLGGDTVLRVVQLAEVPVFAVDPQTRSLPRVALVAEDFSDFSREAGALVTDLLEPGGALHVAHVVGGPIDIGVPLAAYNWMDDYLAEVNRLLEVRRHALVALGGGSVQTHIAQGSAGDELMRLAEETGAEVVAAGRQGRGSIGRLLVGSVSTALVRRAKCSVLVVPSAAVTGA